VENGLFVQVEPESSAVMPNPFPPPNVKTRALYKFAGKIVGKCLYESSYGTTYSQYLPVRLAKSFLGTIHILRKHLYSEKINLTSKFFTKLSFFVKTKEFLFQRYILTKFSCRSLKFLVHEEGEKCTKIRENVAVDNQSA
jgi:hypothetical protein